MNERIPILGRRQVIDPIVCPHCEESGDLILDSRDVPRRPSPGDLLICSACGWPMAFGDGLTPRLLNRAEAFTLAAEPRFLVDFFMKWAVLNVEGFAP